jgi:RNA polymerase sigma-70 factor (ECF subfamily)
MSFDADNFRTLIRAVQAGSRPAAERLCHEYQSAIIRVVRHRLPPRLRNRYDSLDFVNDVWLSFFSNPPQGARIDDPEDLIGYLCQMARNKINEVTRQAACKKSDVERERPLESLTPDADGDPALFDAKGTPSQIVGAEDEFENMLRNRDPVHKQILTLLRQGSSYREIADYLNTTEKTIWRLVRRLNPEAQQACPPP